MDIIFDGIGSVICSGLLDLTMGIIAGFQDIQIQQKIEKLHQEENHHNELAMELESEGNLFEAEFERLLARQSHNSAINLLIELAENKSASENEIQELKFQLYPDSMMGPISLPVDESVALSSSLSSLPSSSATSDSSSSSSSSSLVNNSNLLSSSNREESERSTIELN